MQQRVRITSSRVTPFVCQTTPHFDSTSREVSYSVQPYLTRKSEKCKSLFLPFSPVETKAVRQTEIFVDYDEISSKTG